MSPAPPPADEAWICKKCGMPSRQRKVRTDAFGAYFTCLFCWARNAIPWSPLSGRPRPE
jgi:hypothetical protein